MRSWKSRLSWAASSAVLLTLCGCFNFNIPSSMVLLENPLPHAVDDRIVGSWAYAPGSSGVASDQIGKLAYVIRRGSGQSGYDELSPDQIQRNEKPSSQFYLAKVGDTLLREERLDCDSTFVSKSLINAPDGCWILARVTLSGDSLEFDGFDGNQLVRMGMAGETPGVALVFGGGAGSKSPSEKATVISQVIISGKANEVTPFLTWYARNAATEPTLRIRLHRI